MLFSDIEGSTALLNRLGDRYAEALSAHRALLRAAFSAHRGQEMGTEGDSFFVVFESAGDAVRCCVAAQRSLSGHGWPGGVSVRVRMGLHSGEPVRHGDEYVGLDVHRAARIAAAAHGGQVVVSEATRQLVASRLPAEVSVRDLGWYWLKDLEGPERIYQLVAPGLAEEFPPLKSLDAGIAAAGMAGVHGFPAALTSFVGRDGPAREVAALLDGCRLVTVTGPGGSGKTRLAGEISKRVAGRFADGVWLAELAPVQDPELVPSAVAAALGVREQPGVPVTEVLARALARRQLLLVLDNCEHVIAAAAGLCARLLDACDDVRILATSREPLAVGGEARYRLEPLSLPGPGEANGAGGSEAVALFADRARSADAHFALDGQAAVAVGRLVTRLDGMPLAIELAAARVEALGVGQLLDRLDDRFALLAGGDRRAAARQRSLAATVEWSYQLLDEAERRVFRAVSVFPAGFTLDGAEAVAGKAAGPAVLRLVDCSLLTPPRPGPDGRARYSMLETLRAYGTRLLAAAGEQDQAAAALAGWAVETAEQAAAGLQTRTGEAAAARWLDAEDATISQVLAWGMGRDRETALRLAAALDSWWYLLGRLPGLYPLLAELAGYAELGSDRWCGVQQAAGWAAHLSNDMAGALGVFTVLRDAVADRPPSRVLADALAGRSLALMELGQVPEAVEDARRALAVAREAGYRSGEARVLAMLAMAAAAADDVGEAVRLARQAGQVPGDIPPSTARTCRMILTEALIQAGDFAAAEPVCAAGLAASRDAGDLGNQPDLLYRMALLDLQAGRTADAAAHLREALQLALRAGIWREDCLDYCGHLCAATGRPAEAVTAWAAYAALITGEDWPGDARRRQEPLRAARQALGPEQVRAAEERGAAMSWAVAAEYTLLLAEPPGPQQPEAASGVGGLSARERELVTLVAQGRTNAQIAAQLHISVRTVGSHLDRIRDKTGCRRRADLTRLALTAGLV
jgi:predicted ATPase/class 3 adenylate cyclase/DNA-binding CsgD family transcriptional regulator